MHRTEGSNLKLSSLTDDDKPTLKYHTKGRTSNFSDSSSNERSSEQSMILNSKEKVETCCCSFAKLHQPHQTITDQKSFCSDSQNCLDCSLNFYKENSDLKATCIFPNIIEADNLLSWRRLGLSGSLMLPASLALGNPVQPVLSKIDTDDLLHDHFKSKKLTMADKRSSFLQSTLYSPNSLNSSSMNKITSSGSASTRCRRPRPTSATLAGYDRGTNTVNSFLTRSSDNQHPVISSSCLTNGNKTKIPSRPKSSYRHQVTNMHARPVNTLVFASSVKTKTFGFNGTTPSHLAGYVSMSRTNSPLGSFSRTLSSKKLKPVFPEGMDKFNAVLGCSRLNGLNQLSLTGKPISLASNDEGKQFNYVLNARRNSSVNESSRVSSFCSESLGDCSCDVHSLQMHDDAMKTQSVPIGNSETFNTFDQHANINKVRPISHPIKVKQRAMAATHANSAVKNYLVETSMDNLQNTSWSNSRVHKKEDPLLSTVNESQTARIASKSKSEMDVYHPADGDSLDENQSRADDDIERSNSQCSYEDSLIGITAFDETEENIDIDDVIATCHQYDMESQRSLQCGDYDDAMVPIDESEVTSLDEDIILSECAAESNASATPTDDTAHEEQIDETSEKRKPALIISRFSNCPPVINFSTQLEEIEPLPPHVRKSLKWRMSTITPIVVRNTILRSGFRTTKKQTGQVTAESEKIGGKRFTLTYIHHCVNFESKNHEWLGYFGKHMKSSCFRSLREYQKINHFPGSFQLGRKDRLWRNISRMQTRYGKKDFGFVPRTYILPWDKNLLKSAWEDGGPKQKYILKPPASARGIGIKVIHKWNQIPTKRPIMVQKYLSHPYLINGNKFDLRLYVHVTSFDPLRIYLFDDGLVRFATCKYSSSMKHLSNKFMHLTNYSINKKSGDFKQNDNASLCQGHKWSLKALWGYMKQQGINTDKIWEQMKDIVIKTIISVEQCSNSLVKSNCRRQSCCYELFGFDIMLDNRLRPWLLEVNISPSLHSNSPLDVQIKGTVVKDMFNLCGFLLPDKKLIAGNASPGASSAANATMSFSRDKRRQGAETSPDSKAKHAYFAQYRKSMDEQSTLSFFLDTLTVNDIRVLVESEDEAARCGRFQKIFPCLNKKYLRYFEQPRYYNEMLHVWEVRYSEQRERGISLLESFCRKNLHLPHDVDDACKIPSENIWKNHCLNHIKASPSPRVETKMSVGQIKPSRTISHLSMQTSNTTTLALSTRSRRPPENRPRDSHDRSKLGNAEKKR